MLLACRRLAFSSRRLSTASSDHFSLLSLQRRFDLDEAELRAFDAVANKLIDDTCDALQTNAVVASLLFASTFQSVIGRPTFFVA